MFSFHEFRNSIGARFRAKRLKVFRSLFDLSEKTTILDVGGYKAQEGGWSSASPALYGIPSQITTMNLSGPVDIVGDARSIPLPDKSFDIVFSNSVLEHVGTEEDQYQCASEIRRVGRSYFVQTPNRWFPFEIHWDFPLLLLHWLPRKWFDPSPRRTRDYSTPPLRILSARELKKMFPDCTIKRERFLGFTKSIIAVRLDQ